MEMDGLLLFAFFFLRPFVYLLIRRFQVLIIVACANTSDADDDVDDDYHLQHYTVPYIAQFTISASIRYVLALIFTLSWLCVCVDVVCWCCRCIVIVIRFDIQIHQISHSHVRIRVTPFAQKMPNEKKNEYIFNTGNALRTRTQIYMDRAHIYQKIML